MKPTKNNSGRKPSGNGKQTEAYVRHLHNASLCPSVENSDPTAIPTENCHPRGGETSEVGSHSSVIKWVMDILGRSIGYKCAPLGGARYII